MTAQSGKFKGIRKLFKWSNFVSSIGWMIASEGVSRATRLVTLVVLGLSLDAIQYGTLILALACHDLIRAFSRTGLGSAIIQSKRSELPSVLANARWLQWAIYLALAAIQISIADLIAHFYGNPELASLLKWMAVSYLLYPIASITVFMLQRAQQFKIYSLCSGLSIATDNLSCALLVLAGYGIESIAYSKFIAALIWVISFSVVARKQVLPDIDKNHPVSLHGMVRLLRFSAIILASETMKLLRLQSDLFIAGRLLPAELFGIYGFARNMGVGLAQSLSSAFITVWHPWLVKRQLTYRGASALSLKVSVLMGGIFVVQAIAAQWYIPLLFDGRWDQAMGITSLLCLTATPHLIMDSQGLSLRVHGHLFSEVLLSSTCAAMIAGLLILWPIDTATDMAIATLTASFISLISLLPVWFYATQSQSSVFAQPTLKGA